MATHFSLKKSSIPRAAHDHDRQDLSKSKLRGPKPPQHKQHPVQSNKPPPNDGLLPEDEDAVRRSLLELEADRVKMKQTLEDTVREAEERLVSMEKLLAERERLHSADMTAAAERTGALEEQIESYEKTLIENNIDPVTGTVTELTEEQAAAVEKQKKVTKKDVNKMREKLQQLNENSDKYLIDIQTILQDIEEVEASSQRASDKSELDNLSHADMLTLIQEVEEAQRKEEREKAKKKKAETGEEGGDTDEEEEEDDNADDKGDSPLPEEDKTEKENKKPRSQSAVFITQKK